MNLQPLRRYLNILLYGFHEVGIWGAYENGTWYLVPNSSSKNVIGNKWIYKIKYNSEGEIEKYKARLVAKGFSQKYGFDYEETFSPIAKMVMIRLILSLSIARGWKVIQLDVKSAFLNGDLDVEIFISQKGFLCKEKSPICASYISLCMDLSKHQEHDTRRCQDILRLVGSPNATQIQIFMC